MSSPALPWASNIKNVVTGFLGWKRWGERLDLVLPSGRWKAHEYPGVYLFADFREREPPPTVSWDDNDIFYVGETGRMLSQRWFDYQHHLHGVWGKSPEDVWVAAFPTWIGAEDDSTPEPLTTQFRLYTERRIIWEHVLKGHHLLNLR